MDNWFICWWKKYKMWLKRSVINQSIIRELKSFCLQPGSVLQSWGSTSQTRGWRFMWDLHNIWFTRSTKICSTRSFSNTTVEKRYTHTCTDAHTHIHIDPSQVTYCPCVQSAGIVWNVLLLQETCPEEPGTQDQVLPPGPDCRPPIHEQQSQLSGVWHHTLMTQVHTHTFLHGWWSPYIKRTFYKATNFWISFQNCIFSACFASN